MKTLVRSSILIILQFSLFFNLLGAQNYEWARNIGGNVHDYGQDIVTDSLGNVYITGKFQDTVDFDSGTGIATLVSQGYYDIFIAKYDGMGNYVWAKKIGGIWDDYSFSIVLDDVGYLYICGAFSDTVDFDPGSDTVNLTTNGFQDSFVAKYNTDDGAYVWAINWGGMNQDHAFSLALDKSGNIYVTGYYTATADFDPGSGTANLVSNGNGELFVAKYDKNSNYLWAIGIGDIKDDIGFSIILDSSNNIYVTGTFNGSSDFDPGIGVSSLTATSNFDIFIAKYDSLGNYVWAIDIGKAHYILFPKNGFSLAIDGNENLYVTGSFEGTSDFDPGSGIANLISNGGSDIFIAKYDGLGNYIWAKSIGGTGDDVGFSITLNSSSDLFITGQFRNSVDFDPGIGTAILDANPLGAYIASYDTNGDYIWAGGIGGSGNCQGYSLDLDNVGNIYITGYLSSTIDFDPASGVSNLTSNGQYDIFIAKYSQGQVGIEDENIEQIFFVYPNPNTGQFILEMDLQEKTKLSIKLYHFTGQLIHSEVIDNVTGNYTQQMDLSRYAKGIYYVQIMTEKGFVTSKVVYQ